MAITGGILLGVGVAASGGAAIYSAVKGEEFRDEQRAAMQRSEERQTKLDNEYKASIEADAKKEEAIAQRDSRRRVTREESGGAPGRAGSVLTSPLGIPSGSKAGAKAGGGSKTLLGM